VGLSVCLSDSLTTVFIVLHSADAIEVDTGTRVTRLTTEMLHFDLGKVWLCCSDGGNFNYDLTMFNE